jgi:chaperonin GroEL (HSP60 family)
LGTRRAVSEDQERGLITVEEANSLEAEIEVVEGVQVDRSYQALFHHER